MVKYKKGACRLCRREGTKLFLKGPRCNSEKCAFSRRSFSPGQHGQARSKISDYGVQLREKQKVKRIYGLTESQFRLTFKKAERTRGVTGEMLLQLLERRLDNLLFRLNWAVSRRQARQIVAHRFVFVNNRLVDVPSYIVRPNEVIQIKAKENKLKLIKEIYEKCKERQIPAWLEPDQAQLKAKVVRLPQREEVNLPIQEQLIVELYSKV
jgi:small subunit ribosomal protein S4